MVSGVKYSVETPCGPTGPRYSAKDQPTSSWYANMPFPPQNETPSSSTNSMPQVNNMFTAETVNINGGTFIQINFFGDPLGKLKHVPSAGILAQDDDGCMEGTRTSLLNDLQQWSMDDAAPPIFWLDGIAGTGKSAIARSFCRSLHEAHRLGGSFFCQRAHESRAKVKHILPTLAWFLAHRDPQYQRALLGILHDAPDVAAYSIKRQVEFLLETPLHRVQATQPPLVLAIDALDECSDAEEIKQLLDNLLSVSKDLPVKFFLTSRPEQHIVPHFVTSQSKPHRILRLHDIAQDLIDRDISIYLNKKLRDIRFPSMFPHNWPSPRDIEILTQLAGKLFINAFTAVKFIAAKNPVERLETLTKPTVDPLHLSDIDQLLVVAPDDICENADRIRAVVNVPATSEDDLVSPCDATSDSEGFLTTDRALEETGTSSILHHDMDERVDDNFDQYFRTVHSRRLATLNTTYPLPADQDEVKRSELHHRLCQFIFEGRNYIGPVRDVLQFGQHRRVLDLGTGSGIWAIDMADEFPRAEVIGIDLVPISPRQVPRNCTFEVLDLEEFPLPYPDKHFDFIHARSLHIGITDYPSLLRELGRLLRPGGLVLLIEPTLFPFTPPSPQPPMEGWQSLWETYRACLRQNDIDTTVPERLSELLEETSDFDRIYAHDGNIPVGFWPEDPHLLSVGQIQWMDFDLLTPALRPLLLHSGLPPSHVDWLIRDAQHDLYYPSYPPSTKLHIAYAFKKLSS